MVKVGGGEKGAALRDRNAVQNYLTQTIRNSHEQENHKLRRKLAHLEGNPTAWGTPNGREHQQAPHRSETEHVDEEEAPQEDDPPNQQQIVDAARAKEETLLHQKME
ncbi:hypothetical protein CYMTET_6132 [Cymbomonas tetramitiformis]|uniref:Uncharacterized protein n=1 Tax=Cymbomonas tetramitiformis TaxID=36881 RepID=A0AAE0GZQ4_9CHLO|nr:hypothetical protein CYMTET_6132 [Cymbomonas tetramitiformis]